MGGGGRADSCGGLSSDMVLGSWGIEGSSSDEGARFMGGGLVSRSGMGCQVHGGGLVFR